MPLPEFLFHRVTADIRQQMDGVLALTEQLARQRLSSDAQACVDSVAEAAASVRRTLDSLADLNGGADAELDLNVEALALRELMDAVQDRWQARAAQAGVTLLVSYDGAPDASALADRARLIQIFDGLIAEALSSQARGSVEVGLRVTDLGDRVVLDGKIRGAHDANTTARDHVDRLRDIDAALGLEAALGALLAGRLVQRMQGALALETAAASTTRTFTLNLKPIPEAPAQPAMDEGRSAHVLVVDDNATNRMVAQSLVEMFDCTSEMAEDGQTAVEAARSGRFDLILMDIKMPRMDGVAAARAIRQMPGRAGRTPIIALTANADPDDARSYIAAGMNGVVEKPMKPEQLLIALQRALSESATEAAA
jgi:two-component system, sensor histidine kinase